MTSYSVLHSRETREELMAYLDTLDTPSLLKRYDELRKDANMSSQLPSDVACRKALGMIATILNRRPTLK